MKHYKAALCNKADGTSNEANLRDKEKKTLKLKKNET